ncbi:hypothetical protein PFICI_06480 [Pestalotiopsis fici W106-1]|uniref:Uncharacterized protein n=1 Tax=Pestalotiopsis fici (strain W106-1 / CGMCC3.15140) TaxID=1229662 RepID=W3X5R8_PESFW|nr:uncharacterized protein PFICI_06480 [Pestalotiopsis fici W106-1]ETS81478.1 hypothetical protein PFICI_06480 [Pestalotiopsis fici W106-1]
MSNFDARNDALERQQAVNVASIHGPFCPGNLWDLGYQLEWSFDAAEDIDSLHDAVALAQSTLKDNPNWQSEPDRYIILSYFGRLLHRSFNETGNALHLHTSIHMFRLAVDADIPDKAQLALIFSTIGCVFGAQYGQTRNLDDLQQGLDMSVQAVDVVPEDHPTSRIFCSNMGTFLSRRFLATSDIKDLEDAVDAVWQAFKKIPRGYPSRAPLLWRLYRELEKAVNKELRIVDDAEIVEIE